ncbi:unnamed protein product [Durusdinium trenchii]|uniref:EF-hand domain-containing protein n=1 Tax=Durusdinium trenchii TaxID=1381693 RepID=A0ABP0NZ96_9DINO
MPSFEQVLEQLAEIHDQEVARLARRCSELEQRCPQDTDEFFVTMSDDDRPGDTKTSRGFTDICCLQPSFLSGGIRATGAHRRRAEAAKETTAPDAAEPPFETVTPGQVFLRSFSAEVAQLGFRIRWEDVPSVQMLDPQSAAYQSGLRNEDTILEINGACTAGQHRDQLLPLLKQRPLELKLRRPGLAVETAETSEPSPRSLRREVSFGVNHSQTGSSWQSLEDIPCKEERVCQKRSEENGQDSRLGLKKYVEQQAQQETVVSKTVRTLIGATNAESTDAFIKLRRLAADFAIWWDSLEEPPRHGRIYDVVESRWFRFLSAFIITVNAAVVTWLTDWSLSNDGKNNPPGFEFVDLAFLFFYFVEVVLRITVSKGFFFVNDNAAWNIFDLSLVVFSTLDCIFNWPADGAETPPNNLGYMRVFRMFKFAKILRTIRIISFVRELSMMLESFRKCIVAMFWGLVLLMFLLYVFALIFAQGVASHLATHSAAGTEEELGPMEQEMMTDSFGSVGASMLSLYLSVTGGNDWSMYYAVMVQIGSFYPAVFLSYTFFFIFALFNILTGVFVERAVAASLPDREELISEERKKLLKQVEELRALFKDLDTDASGKITKSEFINDMKDDRIVSYMHSLGLEMHDAEHFFDIIADHCQEVDIDTFIEHSMAMKGSATALDMRRQLHQTAQVAEQLQVWDNERWPQLQRALRRLALRSGEDLEKSESAQRRIPGRGLSKSLVVGNLPSIRSQRP